MGSILIRTPNGKCFTVDTYLTSTSYELKKRIYDQEGLFPYEFDLFHASKRLDENDKRKLSDYGISKESMVHLVMNDRFKW
jgi:hypothetical protein